MRRLLSVLRLEFPLSEHVSKRVFRRSSFVVLNGCVLLKREYKRSRVASKNFPDKTGYECFVNHVHIHFDGTRRSMMSCLKYCTELDDGLIRFAPRRELQVIVSFSSDGCTVRFHQIRTREPWLAANLEGYKEEAILCHTAGEFARVEIIR
jgi:hypothetical protein